MRTGKRVQSSNGGGKTGDAEKSSIQYIFGHRCKNLSPIFWHFNEHCKAQNRGIAECFLTKNMVGSALLGPIVNKSPLASSNNYSVTGNFY